MRALPLLVLVAACSEGHNLGAADAGAADGGAWRAGPPLPVARFEGAGAAAGGRVYFIGGITGVFGDQSSARESDRVDVFDPSAQAWSSGPALPAGGPRHHLAVTVLDDKIYVLGGFNGILGGTQVFVPNPQSWVLDGGSWRRLADQPIARGAATAQAIGGRIYVAGGGRAEPDALADLYMYDPAVDRWAVRAPMPIAREHLASCALDGQMLVVGGWFSDVRQVLPSAQAYDPGADSWSVTADMPTARGGLGAAVVGDECFAVGGEEWHGPDPGTFTVVEGWHAGAWERRPPMATPRHGLGVAALDGAIYAVGGGPVRGNSYTDVVEIFTP
jgi:N-acetylneuraminic acid mutarotase